MIGIENLLTFLEDTFQVSSYADVSYNGLQFEGKKRIQKIVTGVDATTPFLNAAVEKKADFAVVHHGLFWKGDEWRKIDRFSSEKVAIMIKGNLNLYALHLPLDSHREFGNNVRIATVLDAMPQETFYPFQKLDTGLIANFGKGITLLELKRRMTKQIGPILHHLDFGPKRIKTVGIVSGGGWRSIQDPLARKVDAIITGEIIHQAYASCQELGVHMFSLGHYASEIFGVKALGEALSQKFGLEHTFLDFPTGL